MYDDLRVYDVLDRLRSGMSRMLPEWVRWFLDTQTLNYALWKTQALNRRQPFH